MVEQIDKRIDEHIDKRVGKHVERVLPAMLIKTAPNYAADTQKLISRIEENLDSGRGTLGAVPRNARLRSSRPSAS